MWRLPRRSCGGKDWQLLFTGDPRLPVLAECIWSGLWYLLAFDADVIASLSGRFGRAHRGYNSLGSSQLRYGWVARVASFILAWSWEGLLSFKVFPQWAIFHGWLGEVDRQLRFDGLWVGREG